MCKYVYISEYQIGDLILYRKRRRSCEEFKEKSNRIVGVYFGRNGVINYRMAGSSSETVELKNVLGVLVLREDTKIGKQVLDE